MARPQAKNRAGRTRPLSCRTWPHPYVPTSLLENWTARTRTGFLVLRLRVIRYERRNKRAAATTKKLRPGRGRPRHNNGPQPAAEHALHHSVHISAVVSTTVLTITTAHKTAISIPVLIALHFLFTAIVRALVSLTLVHITIDK